jgi:lipid A 4'-phosphatase
MTDTVRQVLALGLAAALAFAVFAIWPGLDLWVTGLFFDPAQGFVAADEGVIDFLRLALWRASEALLLTSFAALIIGLFTRSDVLSIPRRLWGFIVLLYLLAPGLLVDVILKRVWGRARPSDVTEFGGTLPFTPPHQWSDACTRNCSFVAGEVSGAVALAVSLALILHQFRHRMSAATHRAALGLILLLPLFSAYQRIAAGRHFLSDAIFATIFVLLVAAALKALVLQPRKP